MEKSQEVVLFSAVDLKIFPIHNCPEIYGRKPCSWEETKLNAQNETEGEREKKRKNREGGEEGRRESKQEEGITWADVPLLSHAPTCHHSICKPTSLRDAKHPQFSDFSAEAPPNVVPHN